jgi:phosphonate transport system substrate-binding protein
MVISGEADCAAIDSTVLEKEVQDLPELATQLRVIESLRSPMPPIVAARSLGADRIPQLQSALLQPDMNFKPLASRRNPAVCPHYFRSVWLGSAV